MLDNRCNRVLTPGRAGDAAGRRVELVPRPGPRRLRPPGRRLLAAVADAAGDPPPGGLERALGRLATPRRRGSSPRRSAAPSTWSTGRRSAARSRRSASCSAGSARATTGRPGRRRRRVRGARLDQRALRRRAPLVRRPGRVRHPDADPGHQLTCSPVHNQVPAFMRPLMRFGWSRVGRPGGARPGPVGRACASRPGPGSALAGPYFGNAVSTLLLTGRSATVRVEGTDQGRRPVRGR